MFDKQEMDALIFREQLRSAVKGLGEKTFEQCAGFVKIYPSCQNQSVIESKIRYYINLSYLIQLQILIGNDV